MNEHQEDLIQKLVLSKIQEDNDILLEKNEVLTTYIDQYQESNRRAMLRIEELRSDVFRRNEEQMRLFEYADRLVDLLIDLCVDPYIEQHYYDRIRDTINNDGRN